MASGVDLDGDGRRGRARDALGYGRFAGDGGMALLSRWPLGPARDLSALPWRDLPGHRAPRRADRTPFPSAEAEAVRRLSSVGHWIVPVEAPDGPLTVLAFAATTPVFDGTEDLNGRRNADEVALWRRLLDGTDEGLLGPAPGGRLVLMGLSNLDPADGSGLREEMAALLGHPRLRDPRPSSGGGRLAADAGQAGDPALDTADWPGAEADGGGPGNLRVTYVLPSTDWEVSEAGVLWPAPGEALAGAAEAAGPHRLVWAVLR